MRPRFFATPVVFRRWLEANHAKKQEQELIAACAAGGAVKPLARPTGGSKKQRAV